MNRAILKPGGPQAPHVLVGDRGGRQRELVGVDEQRPLGLGEAGLIEAACRERGENGLLLVGVDRSGGQKLTESRPVMDQSIVAAVQRRDADAEHLALASAQRARPAHQFQIELGMLAHHLHVDAVDLQDVVRVGHSFVGRQLDLAQVANERHSGLLIASSRRRAPSRLQLVRFHTRAHVLLPGHWIQPSGAVCRSCEALEDVAEPSQEREQPDWHHRPDSDRSHLEVSIDEGGQILE